MYMSCNFNVNSAYNFIKIVIKIKIKSRGNYIMFHTFNIKESKQKLKQVRAPFHLPGKLNSLM